MDGIKSIPVAMPEGNSVPVKLKTTAAKQQPLPPRGDDDKEPSISKRHLSEKPEEMMSGIKGIAETSREKDQTTVPEEEPKPEAEESRWKRSGTSAKYAYDKSINRITITITDKENNNVIREIPPEETRKVLAGLQKTRDLAGIAMDQGI